MGTYQAHNRRMRQTICDAMLTLLEAKPFTKITVQDIMERAQIQRATFYHYFRDKYQVAEEINQHISQHLAVAYFDLLYNHADRSSQDLEAIFDLRYRKVIDKLMDLRVESIDLPKSLLTAFSALYRQKYREASELEAYMASSNFLSFVYWCRSQRFSAAQVKACLNTDFQTRWICRLLDVPVEQLQMIPVQEHPV